MLKKIALSLFTLMPLSMLSNTLTLNIITTPEYERLKEEWLKYSIDIDKSQWDLLNCWLKLYATQYCLHEEAQKNYESILQASKKIISVLESIAAEIGHEIYEEDLRYHKDRVEGTRQAFQILEKNKPEIVVRYCDIREQIKQALEQQEEIRKEIQRFLERIANDPKRCERNRRRLAHVEENIQTLKNMLA